MKKLGLKFWVVICLFIVLGLLGFIIYKSEDNSDDDEDDTTFSGYVLGMDIVNDYSYYFSTVSCMNQYLSLLSNKNIDGLLDVLDSKFLSVYGIDSNNLYSYLGDYNNQTLNFEATDMYYKVTDNVYIFYVEGNILSNTFEQNYIVKENVGFLVKVDYLNLAFSIYPLFDSISELPFGFDEVYQNSNNVLKGSNIVTDDFICNLYFSNFISLLNYDIGDTYDLLDSDTKRKFKDEKDYNNYMLDNLDKINPHIFSCSNLSLQGRVYMVKDMNYNVFTFTEESIMHYKVNFTIN